MHELVDYSLVAAILGWMAKNGIEFARSKNSKPNGSAGSQSVSFWKLEIGESLKESTRDTTQLLREISDKMTTLIAIAGERGRN